MTGPFQRPAALKLQKIKSEFSFSITERVGGTRQTDSSSTNISLWTQELSSMRPNTSTILTLSNAHVILFQSLSIIIIMLALSLPLDQMKGRVGGTIQQTARQPRPINYGPRAFPNSATYLIFVTDPTDISV